MKITIQIECDTVGELKSHLKQISHQLKIHQKQFNLLDSDEMAIGTHLADDNCYGTHDLGVVDGKQVIEGGFNKSYQS